MALLLSFGDFELDEARFELRRAGEPVPVQTRVFDLILFLAKHRDRVVRRDELLARVWNDVVVSDGSLHQAISQARRVLGDSVETQRVIRTVRGKGFQFVAEAQVQGLVLAPPSSMEASPRIRSMQHRVSSTAVETEQDDDPRSAGKGTSLCVYVQLFGEDPLLGGSRHAVEDLDVIEFERGSEFRVERGHGGLARKLTLSLPGRLVSRAHAQITRVQGQWWVIDQDSRNGTFLNGVRTKRAVLQPGDSIECGRTLLLWSMEPTQGGAVLADFVKPSRPFSSVTPRVVTLAQDLQRALGSGLPVLLLGEIGVGKSYAARELHALSGRAGPLVAVEASSLENADARESLLGALGADRGAGMVLLENLDRLPHAIQGHIARTLDSLSSDRPRLMSTSRLGVDEVARALDPDLFAHLVGFHRTLPPLRDRRGDIGILVSRMLSRVARSPVEVEVAAARALVRHDWPRNLQELRRSVEVALELGSSSIALRHLPEEMRD